MSVVPVDHAFLYGHHPKQNLLGLFIIYIWPDGSTVHLSRELQSSVAASRQAQDAAEQSLAQVQAQLAALQEQQSADQVGSAFSLSLSKLKAAVGSFWCWPCHQTLHTVLCKPRYEHFAQFGCLHGSHSSKSQQARLPACAAYSAAATKRSSIRRALLLLQATLRQQLDEAASAAEQAQTQLAQTADRLAAHERDAGLVAGALADGLPSLLPKPQAGEEHALGQLQARLRQECAAQLAVSLLRAAATAGQQQQAQLQAVKAKLTEQTQQLSEAARRLQGMAACLSRHGKPGTQVGATAEDLSAALNTLEAAVQQADARLQEQVGVLAGVHPKGSCKSSCLA